MPARATSDVPPEVLVAIQAVGSRSAVEVIRYLARHGPLSRAEIEGAIQVPPATLGRVLEGLVKCGFLDTGHTLAQGTGRGRRFTYSVEPSKVRRIMAGAASHLLAEAPGFSDEPSGTGS